MRKFATIFVLFPLLTWAQYDSLSTKKFRGMGLEFAFNLLDEPTLSFEEYQNVIGSPEFFMHSQDAELMMSDKIFSRNGISARFIFQGRENKRLGAFRHSMFYTGVQYNSGNNYTFRYQDKNIVRSDTITFVSSTAATETYFRDTIYYTDTEYSAASNNIGIYGEFLLQTDKMKPSFGAGFGLAADATFFYQAYVEQDVYYVTALFDEQGNPVYAPVTNSTVLGAPVYSSSSYVYGSDNQVKLPSAYFIRPYIPVRLEASLGDSRLTFDINAKIGTEIQINSRSAVNARMFYSLGMGVNYYL